MKSTVIISLISLSLAIAGQAAIAAARHPVPNRPASGPAVCLGAPPHGVASLRYHSAVTPVPVRNQITLYVDGPPGSASWSSKAIGGIKLYCAGNDQTWCDMVHGRGNCNARDWAGPAHWDRTGSNHSLRYYVTMKNTDPHTGHSAQIFLDGPKH